jgi:hypothetical protein
VVGAEEQHVLAFAQAQQRAAEQRAAGQVEGTHRLVPRPALRLLLRTRAAAEVDALEAEGDLAEHLLDRLSVARREHGPQRLVARDDRRQAPLEHRGVEAAPDPQHHRHVVRVSLGLELVEEPQPLLRKRQRRRPLAAPGDEGRRPLLRRRGSLPHRSPDVVGHLTEQRGLEQPRHRDLDREDLAHAGEELGREQRVPATVEEVGFAPRDRRPEGLGPDLREAALQLVGKRDEGSRGLDLGGRSRQRRAVDLPVRRQRQRVKHDQRQRDHVLRQPLLEEHAPSGRDGRPGLEHDVGDEPALAGPLLPRDHDRLAHLRVPHQHGADLRWLDPEAADLDLVVVAAHELDGTVVAVPRQVPRAVETLRSAAEGMHHESLGREVGTVQIAACETVAAHVQLPDDPHGHGLAAGVEDEGTGVRDRPTDRHRERVLCHLVDQEPRRERRVLRRAVDVQQPRRRPFGEHPSHRDRVHRLAAEQQVAQAAEGAGRLAGHLVEERGGQEQRRDVIVLEGRCELRRRQRDLPRDHDHGPAGEQRAPDLEGGGVEGRARDLSHAVRWLEPHVVGVQHESADPAVRDRDALRRARRARGVDDVREVVGLGPRSRLHLGREARDVGRDPSTRLEADHLQPLRRHHVGERAAGHEHAGARVLEDELVPLAGMLRLQRHVGSARLDDPQHRHDQLNRALEADGHRHVGPDAFRPQHGRQPARPQPQFPVAQGRATLDDRDRRRIALRLLGEELVEAEVARVVSRGGVPFHDLPRPLGLGEERHLPQPPCRVRGHGLEEPQEVPAQLLDQVWRQDLRVVLEEAQQPAAPLPQVQLEVEADRLGVDRDGRRREVREGSHRRLVLQVEDDLQKRVAGRAPFRGELADEPLEGEVGTGVRLEGAAAYPPQQIEERRVPRQIRADEGGRHEVADQPLQAGPVAPGEGTSDRDVVLTGVAAEQRLKRRKHGHEQRGALGLADDIEGLDERWRNRDGCPRAAEGRGLAARAVEGELQGRQAGEAVFPVRELTLEGVPRQRRTLPAREVRVLDLWLG